MIILKQFLWNKQGIEKFKILWDKQGKLQLLRVVFLASTTLS